MKPLIVLVADHQDTNAQLIKLGVGLLEIRVDLFPDPSLESAVAQFKERRQCRIPLLLTVRNDKKEGAKRTMSDAKKWILLQTLLPLCDWVDIELSSPLCARVVMLAKRLKKKVVISVHDFKRTPRNFEELNLKAKSAGADAVKFAFFASDESDLLRLIDFTHAHRRDNLVTMCVGPLGPLSRLVLPLFGSRWVYTFLKNSTAPGQLDIKNLQRLMDLAL